ncbi:TPA: oxo-acid lyase, partial [Escherichia coli]
FFPMGGERSLPELYALATTAARNGMTLIEPTGGIDLDNFSVILKTCLEAGVPRIMPHVYSSIIDPDTGYTRPDDVAVLLNKVKSLL